MANEHLAGDFYIRFSVYVAVGVCVCVSCTTCIVIFSSKNFRSKYIMFLALSVGELANGFSLTIAGTFRMIFISQGRYFMEIQRSECLLAPWPIIMLFAGQFPSFMTLMIAVERVIAVEFPNWYRYRWKNRYRIYLIGTALTLTLVFISVAVVLIMNSDMILKWRLCNVSETTGRAYGITHHLFTAASYVFSLAVLIAISFKMRKGRTPSRDEDRRQKMVLSITAISVTLVSIPNIAVVLNEWKAVKFGHITIGIIYCLFGMHSALSIFVYAIFRPEFRKRLLGMLGMKRANANVKDFTMTHIISK
ncbi:hypothetical protein Aduo_017384 [Ancylostoma duodenale]